MSRKHFKRLDSRWYERNGLNGYVYDFSVDYDAIAVDNILNIPISLIKKNDIV